MFIAGLCLLICSFCLSYCNMTRTQSSGQEVEPIGKGSTTAVVLKGLLLKRVICVSMCYRCRHALLR